MLYSEQLYSVFEQSIQVYHIADDVSQPLNNPFALDTLENLLFRKNWIDTIQWHLEDIIRNPSIDPAYALLLKRKIDKSNQDRTDLVEIIDYILMQEVKDVTLLQGATINTETPAWAIDRLSILALKIYHMAIETKRTDVDDTHRNLCQQKLEILWEQKIDLFSSIDQLISDLKEGKKKMKLYKQMKMYNDPLLNPVLYKK